MSRRFPVRRDRLYVVGRESILRCMPWWRAKRAILVCDEGWPTGGGSAYFWEGWLPAGDVV